MLRLAIRAGEIMMQSGAEIYRVEDTITRICTACHIRYVEVFATPTGIFVSLYPSDEEGDVLTSLSRIHYANTNLKKISDINEFSREFTTTDMTIEEGLARLNKISKQDRYPIPLRLLGAGLVAGFFCALLSGNPLDSFCSGCIGVASYALSIFLHRYAINYFIRGFCCCALSTILALISVSLSIGASPGSMVIGSLMIYVPGAALTNSIRDFLSGDMLAGIARAAEALVVAVSLATGAGIVIKLWAIHGLGMETAAEADNMGIAMFIGFAATFGFCILMNVPKENLIAASVIGGAGWVAYQLTQNALGMLGAMFIASCVVGLASDICSRIFKQASTVFTIPGIIPLLPGSGIYYTMLALISGNLGEAATLGAQTLFSAGAIAIGLLAIGSAINILLALHRRIMRVVK